MNFPPCFLKWLQVPSEQLLNMSLWHSHHMKGGFSLAILKLHNVFVGVCGKAGVLCDHTL